jgi:tRNA threonylcarbamoyladenosine biosynthesis protein TsaE
MIKKVSTFNVSSLGDLDKVSRAISDHLKDVKVIAFSGELGSGKTTLIKNLCTFLGVKEAVSSPSYSLVNEYSGKNERLIYHFDCYRLNNIEEALDIGIDEYLDSGNLCLIEWPEQILPLLPEQYLKVEIQQTKQGRTYSLTYL